MCMPYYQPHAFVPNAKKAGFCGYCSKKLSEHPYWEEERATAAAAIVAAAGEMPTQ